MKGVIQVSQRMGLMHIKWRAWFKIAKERVNAHWVRGVIHISPGMGKCTSLWSVFLIFWNEPRNEQIRYLYRICITVICVCTVFLHMASISRLYGFKMFHYHLYINCITFICISTQSFIWYSIWWSDFHNRYSLGQ